MTRSRYNITEAINRLLRTLEGKSLTSDTPGVIPGEVLSYNDAWSDLAELFEGSLPNETLHLPAAGVPFASVVEANAGTSNTVVLSPASHGWSHEWGGIYINTGSSQAFTALHGQRLPVLSRITWKTLVVKLPVIGMTTGLSSTKLELIC